MDNLMRCKEFIELQIILSSTGEHLFVARDVVQAAIEGYGYNDTFTVLSRTVIERMYYEYFSDIVQKRINQCDFDFSACGSELLLNIPSFILDELFRSLIEVEYKGVYNLLVDLDEV